MRIAWNRLTIEQAEKRCPDIVKRQIWEGVDAEYWFDCAQHGLYKHIYDSHRRGHGCPNCGNQKVSAALRLTIKKMEQTCPDLEKGQESRGADAKYWFFCGQHGRYQQGYDSHRRGAGCPKCGRQKLSAAQRLTVEEMERTFSDLEKGQEPRGVHAEYWFICAVHGRYQQTYLNHRGHKCSKCGRQNLSAVQSLTMEEMEQAFPDLEKGQEVRGARAKYWFICEQHGRYQQSYNNHQQGVSCPKCRRSNGEISLSVAASSLGIADYTEQKWFPSCRDKRRLIFDGASESRKILFEYQGFQHYRTGAGYFSSGKNLAEIQRRDRIKRNWARRNGWRLIVVPHTIKNIESYLRKRIPPSIEELPIAA